MLVAINARSEEVKSIATNIATGGDEMSLVRDRDETKEWQQIEEQITCFMCGNFFIDPKTMPCRHTFCKRCIEQTVTRKKVCPLCLAPLSRDQVAGIPTNMSISCLLQIFKSKENTRSGPVAVECGKCGETTWPIVTWCLNCQIGLCQSCDQVHSKLKSHKTVVIKEFAQHPKKMLPRLPPKPKFCKSHTKLRLVLYCTTCAKLVCQDCVLEYHLDHDFSVADQENSGADHIIMPLKMISERRRTCTKAMKESNAKRTPQLCIGQFDFATTDNNEISFKKGDVLEIINCEGDWWYARAKQSGQVGYVPSNYITEYNNPDAQE